MPSLHRQHRQHKTVLSCRCSRCELNWRKVKTVCSWKFRNSFVQSRNVVWTESCLVLTQFPILNVVTYFDVIFGNWVKTSSQMCSHRSQDWTKLFSLQYIEDYWKLSATVANSVHTADADQTRQSIVLSAVWTRHNINKQSMNQRAFNSNMSITHVYNEEYEQKETVSDEWTATSELMIILHRRVAATQLTNCSHMNFQKLDNFRGKKVNSAVQLEILQAAEYCDAYWLMKCELTSSLFICLQRSRTFLSPAILRDTATLYTDHTQTHRQTTHCDTMTH